MPDKNVLTVECANTLEDIKSTNCGIRSRGGQIILTLK